MDPGFSANPPLSLYIHIPWCVKKCPYCDFNSHAAADSLPESAYVEAVLRDLEQDLPIVWGRTVSSVFVGGGTPSLFSGEAIEALLDGVRARLSLHPDCEITLEANPGTVDEAHFAAYRSAGINRLSIGAQSFDDAALVALGRIHDGAAAQRAVQVARSVGFDNINLDLMFGLPGQDVAAAMQDLQTAIGLSPPHLSWYQLTIEPNTAFHHAPPVLPGDERVADMQLQGAELLASVDYTQYEVSAWSRPGMQCRHNLNYWRFGDYLGIGAGAHGKLTRPAAGVVERLSKQRHPRTYLAHAGRTEGISGRRQLSRADRVLEFMLNVLRLREGFTATDFERATGIGFASVERPVRAARADGLMEQVSGRWRASDHGYRFLNDLIARFDDESDFGN